MDDQRVGAAFRAVRLKKRLRQKDVAALAGVSDSEVSRAERGRLIELSLRAIRAIAVALEIRIDLVPRWRGGELDRLLNARHAALAEEVVRWLAGFDGWIVRPEVSFAIYGERGVIDLLAWHPRRRVLLVIELKTEIVDVGELLSTLDRKGRLARRVAADLGWGDAASVSSCLIVAGGSTNRRRMQAHGAVLRAALPDDGRRLRGWLMDPLGRLGAIRTWSDRRQATTRTNLSPVRRVHVASPGRPHV